MSVRDQVKGELNRLIQDYHGLRKLTGDNSQRVDFGIKYQDWYTRALQVVRALAPDRLDEFVGYYLADPKRKTYCSSTYVIQDYVMGDGAATNGYDRPLWDVHAVTVSRVTSQCQILISLQSRIDGVLSDVTGALFADLQDHELESARQLLGINIRAAGVLAGVVLERHLQQVASNHKVTIKKKDPTLSDLNDPLRTGGVYDMPTWRKIQLLGDIRNLCAHRKGTDPTKEQVEELISGVNSIIKAVF